MNSGSSNSEKRKPPAFTRAGDSGETGLVGGQRVRKSSKRVQAYGDIDELNAVLGIAFEHARSTRVRSIIRYLQQDLFVLGSELASSSEKPGSSARLLPRVDRFMVSYVEKETNSLHEALPILTNFILPGGSDGSAFLHLARAVARRAERDVVALSESEPVNRVALQYLNRLSSLLFVMARLENSHRGRSEEVWSGRQRGHSH